MRGLSVPKSLLLTWFLMLCASLCLRCEVSFAYYSKGVENQKENDVIRGHLVTSEFKLKTKHASLICEICLKSVAAVLQDTLAECLLKF